MRRSIIEVGPELVVKGTKTGRERDIVLGPEAMAGLVAHREHLEGQARQLGAELAGDGLSRVARAQTSTTLNVYMPQPLRDRRH